MLAGRRTRAVAGLSVLDSPLRRSTRHRQALAHDNSSPESTASNDAPARSTRRRTATMESIPMETVRSLRPRMNSTASDTTDITDAETLGETKKRVTRRSVAAIPPPETPTKIRLRYVILFWYYCMKNNKDKKYFKYFFRRTTRAGSESKTMSPSVRITRRTRASSVDLDDSHDSKSSFTQINTPIKTRTRASALPSEPAVAEESENIQSTMSEVQEDSPEETNSGNIYLLYIMVFNNLLPSNVS